MRRIGSLVVISLVTSDTGIRGGSIIPVMALVAGGRDMCAGQRPVSIVDRKSSRFPARVGGMAIGTGCRDLCSLVVRVCGGIIIGLVTIDTGIRCCSIIAVMTLVTTCRGMCACQGIVGIVNCESSRFPAGVGSMTIGTGCRYLCGLVIRI